MAFEGRYRATRSGGFGSGANSSSPIDSGSTLDLQQLDQELVKYQGCIDTIGTQLDSQENRAYIKQLRGVIKTKVMTIKNTLKESKKTLDGQMTQFVSQITKFQGLLEKEKIALKQHPVTTNSKTNGSPTGDWVLTDVADSTKLGPRQRIREKMVKMLGKVTHSSTAKSAATLGAERRGAQEAEQHAQASEERAGQVERQWVVERGEIHITEEVLGRGGWGEVKVAEFRGTRVAAKSLYQAIRTGRYYRQLFIREMNMAARIRHPNLVQFIGACMEGGMVILTELLPTSLRKELEREDCHMTPHQLISIGLDVARALSYLHQMQPDPVIHRDISSANVLLEPLANLQWRAKVTDYGSVNFQQQLRTEGPGSAVYAAPEVCRPSLQSPKMDIFSFGVLLVEMCTAEFPEVSARGRLIASIRDGEWVWLIRRCTHQSPDHRPSASDIIAELQQRLED